MDKQIHTEIIINAPLQKVWQIIIQLEDYKNWNPILIECRGIAKTGQRLKNVMRTEGSKTMSFNPIVTKVEEDQYFEWLGSLLVKGIFDGRHSFRLTEISPEQVRLVHREEFSGIASGFILKRLKNKQPRISFYGIRRLKHMQKRRILKGSRIPFYSSSQSSHPSQKSLRSRRSFLVGLPVP